MPTLRGTVASLLEMVCTTWETAYTCRHRFVVTLWRSCMLLPMEDISAVIKSSTR